MNAGGRSSVVSPARLRTVASIGALQLAVMVVLLVRTKLLASWLGPEQVGILGVVDRLLAVFVQSASLSLPFAALRFLSPLWLADRPRHDRLYRRMRRVLAVGCGVAAAAGLAIAAWSPGILGAELGARRTLLLAAFCTVPVLGIVPFVQNALASRAAPRRAMLFLLVHALVFTAASLVGARGWGLTGLYLAYAVAGLPLVALGARTPTAASADAPLGAAAAGDPARFGLPSAVWRFGWTLSALAFAAPFAALFAAHRLLTVHGAAATGWMQAAFGIALAVRAVLGAANQVYLTPRVNRELPAVERGRWMVEYLRKLAIAAAVVVPPLLLVPELVVRLLYSAEFVPAARFVALFVLAEVLTVLGGVPQALVVALDRLGPHVLLNLGAQALLAALAFVLVPSTGVVGVGVAMLAAALWLLVAPALYLHFRVGVPVPAAAFGMVVYAVAGVAGCGALGVFGGGALEHPLAASGAYVALLAGLAVLLTREERADLAATFVALRRAEPEEPAP